MSSKPAAPSSTVWVVDQENQQRFASMFRQMDTEGKQYVTGETCKLLLMSTGVPGQVLAHIWSLCDMNNDGKLNVEQFTLAMYLARQKKVSCWSRLFWLSPL